jgi:RimJ/RimL family protein N-acetyltransferase
MSFVFGQPVVDWANAHIEGNPGFELPVGFGIIKKSELVGAVVFDNYRPNLKSMCVSIVLTSKYALTKNRLNELFSYPFNQHSCKRLICMIEKNNTSSINLATQLGFVHEGTLRQASLNNNDLLVFGMLRNECKWLLETSPNI